VDHMAIVMSPAGGLMLLTASAISFVPGRQPN
jgi:hypothetical protein